MKKVEKPFDCVRAKRQAQDRIYGKIKGLGNEEEAAYFNRAMQNGPFAKLWGELVAKGRKARTSGKLASAAIRTAQLRDRASVN